MKDTEWSRNLDARIWVEEWLKTIKKHPKIPHDPGTMLGWFSNAIMAGYDEGLRQKKLKVC